MGGNLLQVTNDILIVAGADLAAEDPERDVKKNDYGQDAEGLLDLIACFGSFHFQGANRSRRHPPLLLRWYLNRS